MVWACFTSTGTVLNGDQNPDKHIIVFIQKFKQENWNSDN